MKLMLKPLTVACLLCGVTLHAAAQGLSLAASPNLAGAARLPGAQATQADYIVAVVNSEPITNNEVRREIQRVLQQLAQQRRTLPDVRVLAPQVLESLILHKAQLQLARDTGLRVDDAAVDQAEQSVAAQNRIDVPELRRRVQSEGMAPEQFRTQLREQLLLQRLRDRDVAPRVRVSELDVDQYLLEQQQPQDLTQLQINLAQVLVAVPESATPAQLAARQARAQEVQQRAHAGEDFAALVKEFSDAPDAANAGQLGLRTADRYPQLFVQATQTLAVGEVAALVRSAAGFHVLKVLEKSNAALPAMTVTQSHARHILLLPGSTLSEAQARQTLTEFRQRIVAKQADFAALARDNSQDGSAAQGGDLGWANPGMFVPEFEEVMNRLAPGDISEPLVSRFGVHLIELLARRTVALTPAQQRESVRTLLREKKLDEAYRVWAQELRGRAYVDLREPPL